MVVQQNVKLYMLDFVLPEFVTNVTDKKIFLQKFKERFVSTLCVFPGTCLTGTCPLLAR